MSTITVGHDFNTGDSVTGALINSMVDDATIGDITRPEFDDSLKTWSVSATAPSSPQQHDHWFDTTIGLLRIRSASGWDVVVGRGTLRTNNSATVTIEPGDVLKAKGDYLVTWCEPGDDTVLGVAAEYINPSSSGVVQTFGFSQAKMRAGESLTDILTVSSTHTGEAEGFPGGAQGLEGFGWIGQTVTLDGLNDVFLCR